MPLLIQYIKTIMLWIRYPLGLFLAIAIVLIAWAWPEFGTLPTGAHQKKISASPHYDRARNQFVNRRQSEYDDMIARFDFLSLLSDQFFGEEIRFPTSTLPYGNVSIPQFQNREELSYVWLGHSTVMLRLNETTMLFDPVFGNAAPLPFLVTRFQEPVVPLATLPDIDVIVISHDHYDHLDKQTIDYFVPKETLFLVPLGVSAHLMGWGIPKARIIELDWWESIELFGLTFACTPSQHFSGRLGPPGNNTLWASWVVLGDTERVYFSGDSGYDTHFKEIGERFGPFDVAFLETGQYNPMWFMSHMFPEEAVQGAIDLNAKRIHPIHWGMFRLSTHDWFDPPQRVLDAAPQTLPILFPKIGEEVLLSNDPTSRNPWWKEVISVQ